MPDPSRTRLLVAVGLATPVALTVLGFLIFYVLKDPPPSVECSDQPGPEQALLVEDYRRGLGTFGAFAALVLGGAIAAVRRPGVVAAIALAVAAAAVVALNVENDAFLLYAVVTVLLAYFGGEVALLVAAITAIVFAVRERPTGATRALLACLWLCLFLALPAALSLPAGEGVAAVCLS